MAQQLSQNVMHTQPFAQQTGMSMPLEDPFGFAGASVLYTCIYWKIVFLG